MRIVNKLQEWHDNHLLSTQQMHQIMQFEQEKSQERLFPGFVWLGLAIMVLGIIAIVAANWAKTPPNVKLISDFVLLMGTAVAAYHFRTQRFVFNTLIFLLALLSLASIGLIGQVFQTEGTLSKALLFWVLIISPLVCISQYRLLPLIWVWTTLITAIYQLMINYTSLTQLEVVPLLFATPVLLSLCLALLLKRLAYFKVLQHEFLFFGLIGIFLVVPIIAEQLTQPVHIISAAFFSPVGILEMVSGAAMIALLILLCLDVKQSHWQRYMLIPAAFIGVSMVCLMHFPLVITSALALTLTLLLYLFLTVFFALNNQVGLYRLGLLCIGLRMLWLYWNVLHNLMTTALVMLLSGVILIVVSRALLKYKATFLAYIGYEQEQL